MAAAEAKDAPLEPAAAASSAKPVDLPQPATSTESPLAVKRDDLQDSKVADSDAAPKKTNITKQKTKNALLTGLRTGDLHKAVDKMEEDMAAAEAKDTPPDPAAASSIADLTSVNTSLSA